MTIGTLIMAKKKISFEQYRGLYGFAQTNRIMRSAADSTRMPEVRKKSQ